tara:strand:- start:104 stop:1021 length:918 start_codon:yes stop_codon:yes gene_type:complete
LKRPLIHVGYHKAGSTWLQRVLFVAESSGYVVPFSRKLEVYPRLVLPHALDFDVESNRRFFEWPETVGNRVPVITSEGLTGNPESGGYNSVEIAQRLKDVFDDARVLIVFREQKSMILSSYNQYLKSAGHADLMTFLNQPIRPRGEPFFHLDYFRYDKLLRCYQETFGAENVLALPLELLTQDQDEFVRRIASFSGANLSPTLPESQRMNESWPELGIAMKRYLNPFIFSTILNGYSPLRIKGLWRLQVMFPRCFNRFLRNSLSARIRRRWQRQIEEATRGYYAESNRATADISGVDLAGMGYET